MHSFMRSPRLRNFSELRDEVRTDVSRGHSGPLQASTSVMAEEIVGRPVEEAMDKLAEFERMITSRGQVDGDEEIIGDGVAFSGVSQYPARVKCALLGWKAFQAATADALEDK